MSVGKTLALALVAGSMATAATAQYGSRSASFVIHAAPAPEGERTAAKDEPLLVQKVTATAAARLEQSAPTLLGGKQEQTFAAGTPLFGARVPDGWIWCAVSQTSGFFSAGQFACYQDGDNDGQLDHVRRSGTPFMGVPLFVYTPGEAQPLPSTVRYSRVSYDQGPSLNLMLKFRVVRRSGEATGLVVAPTLETPGLSVPIGGGSTTVRLDETGAGTLLYNGAIISILGVTADGGVRYRVASTMPEQISSVNMMITTSTYYVPIGVR